MAARFSLPSLHSSRKGRWAAFALVTGSVGYVGVVTYRWSSNRRRYREETDKRVKWSPLALFSSGMALGVVAMAIGPTLRRWGSPRPDKVFTSVLPMLRANSEVRDLIGPTLKPGLFRAGVYDGGLKWHGLNLGRGLGLSLRKQQVVNFQPYTLQLVFQVHGELSSAMVSLAVRNHTLWGRGFIYDSLVVDLPNGERLLLKGRSTDSAVVQSYSARLS